VVPPAGSVEAAEGFGSVSLQGEEAVLKGKFAFQFRAPGLGRIEALDPLGRTVFTLFLAGDRASFVLPGEKAYAEEAAEALMRRLLGFSLLPDDMIRLLGGRWAGATAEAGPESAWRVEKDEQGRVYRGSRGDLLFTVRRFFEGAGVPRDIEFSRPGTTGRLKVLSLRFNPPGRPEAFDTSFLARYSRKTWEEMAELLKR
jgi:outer membrane biogenesis lipoprotein LolB